MAFDHAALLDRAAEQTGLVTTAQAHRLGVSRLHLSRLESAGRLTRVAQGVYRAEGTLPHEHEQILTSWLAITDGTFLGERAAREQAIVAGPAAASLHGLGSFYLEAVDFLVPRRRTTTRDGIRFRRRVPDDADVTLVLGVPVLTIAATIADLVDQGHDLDHVTDIVREAPLGTLDETRLAELLDPIASRSGHGDGRAFVADLGKRAGLDYETLARSIASSQQLGSLVTQEFLQRVMSPTTDESVARGLAALRRLGGSDGASSVSPLERIMHSREVLDRLGRIRPRPDAHGE